MTISTSTLEKRVISYLKKIGVPANLSGYYYLRYAIQLCYDDFLNIRAITKRLYPSIANHFATTSNRVERAMRFAIEVSFNRCSPDLIEEIFGYTVSEKKGKPTTSEFIATIVDCIHLED